MTTSQAAAILDVTRDQVSRLVMAGRLRGRRRIFPGGRRWQWDVNGQDVRARKRRQDARRRAAR